ncbi:MFS transporter [uncultured Pseudokineococcus sp.]|uniref:MFS transporter n=1 Tax=uncultured Pseudokineococcus sp. TaxID=1642928 RepID=UPI0026163186|nr:MFS transporter [uncultured Pseudokineococcus sp.]
MTAAAARRRYVLLVALRWLPTGLVAPVTVLLAQERGLSLSQVGAVVAVQGFVVLGAELPLGGLADAAGRRPVLLLAGGVAVASLALLALAETATGFAVALAVQGLWRALDSGPLEAWYVDTAQADDPRADITAGLGAGATALNLAMGAGALASGGLVAAGRALGGAPLVLPVVAALAMTVVSSLAVALLVREDRPSGGARRHRWRAALGEVPAGVGRGLRLLTTSRVLLALVAVELFWGFGMVAFETLVPPRAAEVLGGVERAGTWMGPLTSAGWAAAAVGAALVPLLSRRLGPAPVAAGLRLVQGGTVVGMGLLAGPVGLVAAYVACYAAHGASNPVHNGLLHRQADRSNRAVVLSLNSMVSQPSFAVGALVLGALADRTSLSAAMVVGAVVLALAAPLYLPAWRQGRLPRAGGAGEA